MSVSNENDILLTKEGYENIEKELEELKSVRRKEVSDKLETSQKMLNMMKLKMSRRNLKRE